VNPVHWLYGFAGFNPVNPVHSTKQDAFTRFVPVNPVHSAYA
jgi:hypothetical protein